MSKSAAFKHSIALWIIVLISGVTFFAGGNWRHQGAITGDARGYSAYLYAWVVQSDFDFSFYEQLSTNEQERLWLNEYEQGSKFPKLTMGVAMLQLPLYGLAHVLAPSLGYTQDGWSWPYQLAISLSGWLAMIIGLLLTQRLLMLRFSAWVSGWTLLLLVFGTNLLYYGAIDGGQSHVYSFALLAAAIWGFESWLTSRRSLHLWIAAICFGFMVLIRPTNAIFILLPIIQMGLSRSFHLLLNWRVLLAVTLVAMPFFLQMVFWHHMTGNWLVYSYGNEQIFWGNSQWVSGLFSARNGWLIYAPIMALSILGIPFLWRIDRSVMWSVLLLLLLHIYIVFAWWCWYYGSSYGIRPMIDAYAILALPMAAFLRWVVTKPLVAWTVALLVSGVAIADNAIHTWQYTKGWLSGSDMTPKAYQLLSFNTDPPRDLALMGCLKKPDVERLMAGLPERTVRDTVVEQQWRLPEQGWGVLNASKPYGKVLSVPLDSVRTDFDRWMHVQALVESPEGDFPESYLVIELKSERGTHMYKTMGLHRHQFAPQQPAVIQAFLRKPKDLPSGAWLESYFWLKDSRATLKWRDLRMSQIDAPYPDVP